MVQVPQADVAYIRAAAAGTNLPYDVVACQVNAESGFDPSAVSPAGAEGPYQFLPSTFYSVASGSPFSWRDSTQAYIVYMSSLLHEFGGNVRNALGAYNAGPGNYQAGWGYADGILACAGQGNISVGPSGVSLGSLNLPAPVNVQADDWSWYIYQAGRNLHELAVSAQYWSSFIPRL